MLGAQRPPQGSGWAVVAIGLVVGAALGWQRGRFMHIHVDPETHALNQRASPAGMLFLVVLIAVKMGAQTAGGAVHMNVGLIRSEEHTSELQSLMRISYAVFCFQQKKTKKNTTPRTVKSTHEH